ncbi:hypothetical protein THRCLA_20856 [Thraustotheca clavata]|uniref:DNA-directed DNA polymerase n=1 Tax=Thraustotheca clavata TaxID=74557 RepID=A0A1W0A2Z3_9STRA|nr:hypothetical protein THRCLA_20856 [Thraustotheca clavata]
MPINTNLRRANNFRRTIYKQAKSQGLPVQWSMKTDRMQQVIASHMRKSHSKQNASKKIANAFRSFKSNRSSKDHAALTAINSGDRTVEIPLKQFNRIFRNITAPADKSLMAHIKDDYGTITRSFNLRDHHFNADNLLITEHDAFHSGADVDLDILPTTTIELQWYSNPKRSRSERKNFFPYLTKADYSLDSFQVYAEGDSVREGSEMPCFLNALVQAEKDAELVKQISQTMIHSGATTDFIKSTAKQFYLHISVKQYRLRDDGRKDKDTTHYGDKSLPEIKLGACGKHIFAIQPTKITLTSLNRYDLVEKHGTSFVLINGRVKTEDKRIKFLDSYDVISYLYHNRETHLTPITQSNTPRLLNNEYQKVESLTEADFKADNFREIGRVNGKMMHGQCPFKQWDKETKTWHDLSYDVIYFDYETFPDGPNNEHRPYRISWKVNDEPTQAIYGFDCTKRFLDSLAPKSRSLLIAHNAGFDARFIVKHMTGFSRECNIIDAGTKLKQLHGYYYGREIVIKDSMSFINNKLADLPSMFKDACKGLTLEKECFPHELINASNYQSMWHLTSLDAYADKETLISNAKAIEAIKGSLFDAKQYAIHYCKRDVDVLATCFKAFNKMFIDRFGTDVYRFISMPGLAYAIQHNEGCFDGCFSMRGVPLAFAREAIVGGRVMTRDNQKHHTKHQLSDFDAVSLYPSSQSNLEGYVRGTPKLFKGTIPNDADYYIARVRFNSIKTKRHFPLLSEFDGEARLFTNELVRQTMIIGKRALEDIVEFQGSTYTTIEGMYWNEGFNDQICHTIRSLFAERLKLKKEKNPLQNGIKLLMNSAYGKLIQKPIIKQKTFVRNTDREPNKIEEYTHKNIHKLINRTPVSKDIALFEEHKAVYEHWSPAHLGVQVLDMSKHIMNEVMCLAEDIDATIWYQDTDSMHIDRDKLDQLADAFRSKYGRELVGNGLGQFHSDFDLEGSKGEVYASQSIFISKKTYLDRLECDGNDVKGWHIRCKGIPSKLLQDNPLEIYTALFNGEERTFDLAKVCSIDIDSKSQTVRKRTEFKRSIQFK